MIEYTLKEICERDFSSPLEDIPKKSGRYHGSSFPHINGVMVGVYIETKEKLSTLFEEGMHFDQIVSECLEYLNSQMLGQRGKKKTIPKYGKLTAFSYTIANIENKDYISALLITDDPVSKFFWPCRKKKY